MPKPTFISLFAGIGGLDLGLERAGWECIAQVEIDPYCRAVLAKHWPHVARFEDVRDFTGREVKRPDLICGGFPCQDISNAGRRAGIGGKRSGLWAEFHRIIREVRPQFVFVENVSALLGRGLGTVLGNLAEVGYDAEWHCIPASAVNAPHLRDRIWIVAYPGCVGSERDGGLGLLGWEARAGKGGKEERQRIRDASGGSGSLVSNAATQRLSKTRGDKRKRPTERAECSGAGISDSTRQSARSANGSRCNGIAEKARAKESSSPRRCAGVFPDDQLPRLERAGLRRAIANSPEWLPEPDVCRVVNGVSGIVDRVAALGNAVVPQVAQFIGEQLLHALSRANAGHGTRAGRGGEVGRGRFIDSGSEQEEL